MIPDHDGNRTFANPYHKFEPLVMKSGIFLEILVNLVIGEGVEEGMSPIFVDFLISPQEP